ncbi:hypothetical protein FACS1894127_4930 [Clostridia bacterium]|nr:hypothetical protein FACS1894127_4930 [Clostridia bacterium]
MKKSIKNLLVMLLCLAMIATGTSTGFATNLSAADETKNLIESSGIKSQFNIHDSKPHTGSSDKLAKSFTLSADKGLSSEWILPHHTSNPAGSSDFSLQDFSGPYPLNYFAMEGDWTTLLYSVSANLITLGTGTVEIVPVGGGNSSTLDVYWSIVNGDEANGILFLNNIPVGEYRIFSHGIELDRNLKIIGNNEKYVINISQSFMGAWYFYHPSYNSWMYDSLLYPTFPLYGDMYYSGTPYFPGPDNKYYINLYSKNLAPSDILSAEIKSDTGALFATGKAIPSNFGSEGCEMILIFDPQNSNLTPPDNAILSIKFRPDVHGSFTGDTLTEELYYYDLETFSYVDTTNIDQLKVDLVFPKNIGSSLSVQLRYQGRNGDYVFSRISTSSGTGRYTFTLPTNVDLFGTDGYFELILDPPPGVSSPTYFNIFSYRAVDLYAQDFYPTNLNDSSFEVWPESIVGVSRENAVFSLANSSFTPINSVSIKKDNNTSYNSYEFSTSSALPEGDYHIMFGKLPVKKIRLTNTIPTDPPFYGLTISSSHDTHESSAFLFELSTNEVLIPNEWKVVLTNQIDHSVITLTPADGSLLWYEEFELFYNDQKAIPPGIYKKEYRKNDVKVVEDDSTKLDYISDYLVVSPDENSPTIREAWTSLGLGKSNSGFGISGFTTPDAAISGLKVETYKITIPYLNPQSLGSANLQSTTAYEDGYFNAFAGAADLNISEPGVYWFVVTDQSGKILFTTADYFTRASLSVYSSISGTVTLNNQPKAAAIELWDGSVKVGTTTGDADGKFNFPDLFAGVKYTLKIPANASWQAFSADINLTESPYDSQIALKAPGSGGIIIGGSGGGGGGGGSSTSAPVTTSPAVTAPAISTTTSSITTDTGSDIAPVIGTLSAYTDASAIASWAVSFFEQLIKDGIISGRDNGTLDPKGNVTRAEFTKIIVLALDIKTGTDVLNFDDVGEGSWYKEYVDRASSNGIVLGVSDGLFAPDANITRQDLCAIVYRALSHANAVLPVIEALDFSDAASVSDYAKDAVGLLKQLAIVSGRDDGEFDPAAFATREETAKIICGVTDYLKTVSI